MSQTNYTVNKIGDLSTIFNPWPAGSTQATLTNYKYLDGDEYKDLNNAFQPLTTTPTSYTTTGFKVNNYTPIWTDFSGTYDLGQIFAPYGYLPFTVTGGGTYTYTINNTSYAVYLAGSGKITFTDTVNTCSIYIIAGGGGGGGAVGSYQLQKLKQRGGGGGGAGSIASLTNIASIEASTSFNYSSGTGGGGGTGESDTHPFGLEGVTGGDNGGDTTFSNTSFSITTYGGEGGGGGEGGTGGNNTSTGGDCGSDPSLNGTYVGDYNSFNETGDGGDEHTSSNPSASTGTNSNINGDVYIVNPVDDSNLYLGGGGGGGYTSASSTDPDKTKGSSGTGGYGTGGECFDLQFENGGSGRTWGAGGGGGSGSEGGWSGGAGGQGSVIIFFEYP